MGIRKSDTPHHIVRAIFISLIEEKYAGHKLIFTDGSKSEERREWSRSDVGVKQNSCLITTCGNRFHRSGGGAEIGCKTY